MDQDEVMRAFHAQRGGGIMIKYIGGTVGAPKADVLAAVEELKAMSPERRKLGLWRANKAIERIQNKVHKQTATPEQMQSLGMDVVIWYANEILEGRAELPTLDNPGTGE